MYRPQCDSGSPMPSTMSSPRTYPFAIANAFTQDSFAGNPATIVFLDPSEPLTQEERLKFAKGLNQPVVVFLTPTSTSSEKPGAVVSFDVRYFAPNNEYEPCGHGTIATTKVILDSATDSPGFGKGSRFPVLSSPETQVVTFTTAQGIVVSARRVVVPDEVTGKEEDWFEVVLPARKLKKLPSEEEEKVLGIFNRAVGKELKAEYIGVGEPPFHDNLLLVLDESENLEQLKIDASVLVGTHELAGSGVSAYVTCGTTQKATGFARHIITTDSTSGKFTEDYIIRVFAPIAGVDEDHVCGASNCLTGPYWSAQKGITELRVRQVSERGGTLRVGIDGDNIKLRGQVKVTSVGQLFL